MTVTGAAIAIACVTLAVFVLRTWSRARGSGAINAARLHPTDEAGVVIGANAIHLEAPLERGILILHGFNDTPQSVANLAHALHQRGWLVSAPLLPSHGRTDDEIERAGSATEWIAFAEREWDALRKRVPTAVLCGQSMGGAIAAVLAAKTPPRALVLIAPYLAMGRFVRVGAAMWPLWQLVAPVLVSDGRRALRDDDARARSLGRGVFSPRLVAQVHRVVVAARRALPAIRVPTLVIQSRGDYRIPSAPARRAFAGIGAVDKTMVWRDDAGHVLIADRGHEELAATVADWLDERMARD